MRRLLAALALGGLLLAGCGGAPTSSLTPVVTPSRADSAGAIAEPVHLSVPAISAESGLRPVGLKATAVGTEIDVPSATEPLQGAWWTGSPRPGAVGPAVILGHVDGEVGGKAGMPGLFYGLRNLKPGAEAKIQRADGTLVRFVVYDVIQVDKANFPAERIYGNTAGPELRLITCGGEWDPVARSYRSNWIALARLDPASVS